MKVARVAHSCLFLDLRGNGFTFSLLLGRRPHRIWLWRVAVSTAGYPQGVSKTNSTLWMLTGSCAQQGAGKKSGNLTSYFLSQTYLLSIRVSPVEMERQMYLTLGTRKDTGRQQFWWALIGMSLEAAIFHQGLDPPNSPTSNIPVVHRDASSQTNHRAGTYSHLSINRLLHVFHNKQLLDKHTPPCPQALIVRPQVGKPDLAQNFHSCEE